MRFISVVFFITIFASSLFLAPFKTNFGPGYSYPPTTEKLDKIVECINLQNGFLKRPNVGEYPDGKRQSSFGYAQNISSKQNNLIAGTIGWHFTWMVEVENISSWIGVRETLNEKKCSGALFRMEVPFSVGTAFKKCGVPFNQLANNSHYC